MTNSIVFKEVQDRLIEAQKEIFKLQQEILALQKHNRAFELENIELKKKQPLHQGGIIIPRTNR